MGAGITPLPPLATPGDLSGQISLTVWQDPAPCSRWSLSEVLGRLGVRPSVIEGELRAMEQARIGKTASRRILGSMNDFTGMMRSHPWPPHRHEEPRQTDAGDSRDCDGPVSR